nr:hypothetical protein [Tanacetum cinerariifolium]
YILFEQGGPKEDLFMIAFQPQGVSVWEGAEVVHLQAEETKLEYSSRSLKIFSRILDFIHIINLLNRLYHRRERCQSEYPRLMLAAD